MNVASVAHQIATARPWPLFLLLLGIAGIGFQLLGAAAPSALAGPNITDGVTIAACAVAFCAAILQVRLARAGGELDQLATLRQEIEFLHAELRTVTREADGKGKAERMRDEAVRTRNKVTAKLERLEVELDRTRAESLVGMVTFDRTGCLNYANETFRRMLGYGARELQGKSTDDLTAPQDIPRSLELSLQLRAGVADSASIEKRYVRKDGSVFESLTRLTIVRDEKGEAEMVLAQIEDRTERNRLSRSLQRTEDALEAILAENRSAWNSLDDDLKERFPRPERVATPIDS